MVLRLRARDEIRHRETDKHANDRCDQGKADRKKEGARVLRERPDVRKGEGTVCVGEGVVKHEKQRENDEKHTPNNVRRGGGAC